jgi:hypothetical protein
MACDVCGQKLGWFDRVRGRTQHESCREKQQAERHQAGLDLAALLETIGNAPETAAEKAPEMARLKAAAGLSDDLFQSLCVGVLMEHAKSATADHDVSPDEIKGLNAIMKAFHIDMSRVRDQMKDVGRYAVLHQVRDGKLPVIQTTGFLPEEGESVHWACPAALYEEKVIRRYYEGGYSGVSIPIVRGVRWNVGGYRGHPVVQSGMVATDTGRLFVSDGRVVYVGGQRSFSIPYKKILALQGYPDAIAVQKDGMTAKPIYFKIDDPEVVSAILSLAIAYSREPAGDGKNAAGHTFRIEDL